MRLLMLFGAQAVGKMTVGQALTRITPMKLFHNHMTIEPVISLLGHYDGEVTAQLREIMFEAFARSDNYGLIFTMQFAFDAPSDWAYVAHVASIFEAQGAQVDYCELVAPLEVRLVRNTTENRLREKPSKRNLVQSERFLRECRWRDVSNEGECPWPRYLKLDNSALSPEDAAERIATHFGLARLQAPDEEGAPQA